MEVYCEMLNDLLDPSKLNLDVQERDLSGGKGAVLQVKHLTASQVASASAALELIQQGLENRKVSSTAYNDQSSRSHTLCRLLVESAPSSADVAGPGAATSRTSAWLTLVDLAGSEGARAATSKDQAAEARDINRSLLTLAKVVYELAKGPGAGHVPFRDSVLTRLLKPSLTGVGAKVAIICNVTPASSQSEETWNTLRFADGAKRIKVSAVRNEVLDVAAVVAGYQREVQSLKAQLAALTGAAAASAGTLSPEVLATMQATLSGSSIANAADQLADQEAQLRPKSALAASGAGKPSGIPTACNSAGNSPRKDIDAPAGLSSPRITAAVAAAAHPTAGPPQPQPTNLTDDIGRPGRVDFGPAEGSGSGSNVMFRLESFERSSMGDDHSSSVAADNQQAGAS
eukprot:gene7746-7945_t